MENLLGIPIGTVVAVVVGTFLLGVGVLTWRALGNRLLLRLALRNIPRRRAQSALIAVGLALGTVIVSTALNTGDTMSHTVRSLVAGTVGRTDEVIVAPRRDGRRTGFDAVQSIANGTFLTGALTLFDQGEYDRLGTALADDERIAALAPAIVEQVLVVNLTSGELQGQVNLYAVPSRYPPALGRLERPDGGTVDLREAGPRGAILNAEGAAALGAQAGDSLRLYYRERQIELEVADVVRSGDLGGAQATLVLPLEQFQEAAGLSRQINQILVVNRGAATTSVRLSDDVARAIRPLLVEPAAAERLHALLRSDVARAEIAHLRDVDGPLRERLDTLLRELDAERPSGQFAAVITDPDVERRLLGLGGRLAAIQGRAGTNVLSATSTLRVIEIKRLSQELADRWGGALTSVFVVLGLFSFATGAMLVVLIFVLLAAERRSEMGVTRALGAKQRQLVEMFMFEGLAYDLVASAIGLAVGVAIAVVLVLVSADVLRGVGIELRPHLEPRSLLLAYCLGAVLTMLSIAASAWRASRLTVVAAIKDLPEPERTPRPGRSFALGIAALALGIGLGWWGAGANRPLPMGAGVMLVVLGLTFGARPLLAAAGAARETRDRLAFSLGGALLLLYWLAPSDMLRATGLRPLPRSMDLFFLAGLCLVLGAVWLIVFNLGIVVSLVRRASGQIRGGALVARTALAYPTRGRFRTGMAIGMFGLVIFSMVVAAVLLTGTHRAYNDPGVMAGGFDIRVEQTVGGAPELAGVLGEAEAVKATDFSAIASLRGVTAEAIQPDRPTQLWRGINVNLIDDPFTATVDTALTTRAVGYPNDAAVWRALRERPGLALIAGPAVRPRDTSSARPSDPARPVGFALGGVAQEDATMSPLDVWLRDTRGGRSIKLTVVGVVDPRATFGTGLFTSAASLADSGAPPPGRTTYFLKTAPGVSAAEKTIGLNLALVDRGLRASEIGADVARIQNLRMLLNQLLQGFIGVGLVAGVAGLGVVSTRAVVERRRHIGMLRALGFPRRAVQASFLLETSFVALLGIAVGVVLGLLLSFRLVEFLGREFPEIVFTIPWSQIGLIALFAYAASLLTTFVPAYQAGRVNPAEALRYE